MLGSRSEPMQSNITASSTGQSANHLHHCGEEIWLYNAETTKTLEFGVEMDQCKAGE